jgi:hypothetical protein
MYVPKNVARPIVPPIRIQNCIIVFNYISFGFLITL